MGRSVSIPSNAQEIIYLDLTEDLCTEDSLEVQDNFECLVDNIRSLVRERYKSFDDCDIWLDREDHAVLENGHAYVSISEYCGLVAVCLVVKENDQFYYTGHTNVHGAWCAQVGGNFREHIEKCYKGCVLSRRGAFSNGEAVFQRKTS